MRDWFDRAFPKYGRNEPRIRLPEPLAAIFGAAVYLSGFGFLPIAFIIGGIAVGVPVVALVGAAWLAVILVLYYLFST